MKIHGNGLLDMLIEKDTKWFLNMYKMDHWQHIVEYQTFRVTELRKKQFKYVAFIQPGGGIDRLVELEGLDFLEFYADPRCSQGYSNTDGISFVRCYERDEESGSGYKELAFLCMDNSPYDLKPDDSEWPYYWESGEIAEDLVLFLGEGHDSTPENTLYVTQL